MAKKENVKVAKVFLTDGGDMFTEEELKRYELPQSKQLEDEIKWGTQTIEPPHSIAKLMYWLELSVVHASCVYTKVNDSVGIGWRLKEPEDAEGKATDAERKLLTEFFKKVNELEDVTSVCKKTGLDYESCGNGYFEIVRGVTEDEKIKAMYQVNAKTLRLCKDKERWVQQIGQKKVYFKKWGDERQLNKDTGNFVKALPRPEAEANEIIQLKQYTHKSVYYGLPDWLPALYQMYGEMKEKEYNLDFFSNYGIPAYAVVINGSGELGPETKDMVRRFFEVEVKKNPHKTMVFDLPEGMTVKFEQLGIEKKEASFRIYRKDNRDDVLTAHRVPPYRAAIVEKGQLGGDVSPDTDRIYLDSVINPRQKVFTWAINELIIKEGFGIHSLELEFEDIDIRDRKTQAEIDKQYFNMGARTPNEILVSQGKEPYEGGDVYYVPGNLVPIGAVAAEKKLYKGKKSEPADKKNSGGEHDDYTDQE